LCNVQGTFGNCVLECQKDNVLPLIEQYTLLLDGAISVLSAFNLRTTAEIDMEPCLGGIPTQTWTLDSDSFGVISRDADKFALLAYQTGSRQFVQPCQCSLLRAPAANSKSNRRQPSTSIKKIESVFIAYHPL
jgi:hypothetical protein